MKQLSTTIFMVHMPDVERMRTVLHRQNKNPPTYSDNVEFYLNSVHVRKIIPSSDALLARFESFWQWVVLFSAPSSSNPLPLVALKRVHDQQLKNIEAGLVSGAPQECLELLYIFVVNFVTPHSDRSLAFFYSPDRFPVDQMYILINDPEMKAASAKNKELLPKWRAKRGTSHVESLHRLSNKLLAGSFMSSVLAWNKISQFDTENNIKCGIANRGNKDWGTFRHERLQYIWELAERCGFANPLAGFNPIPAGYTSQEHFNVDYSGNTPADTTTPRESFAAGGPSSVEGGPSAAPGGADLDDDDTQLDDDAQALNSMMRPDEPSPPSFNALGDGEPVDAGEPGSTPPAAMSTPAPAAPALATSSAPSPAALAARPSPPVAPTSAPAAGDGDQAGAGTALVPLGVLVPGSTPPAAMSTPAPAAPALPTSSAPSPAALAARPSPPSETAAASRPSPLPASLQRVVTMSQLVGTVAGAVPRSGPGSHQRAPDMSPARRAASVADGTSPLRGRRTLTMGDLAQPVTSKAERVYFFANVEHHRRGSQIDWIAFGAEWNNEAALRNSAATSASPDSDTWFNITSAGHLQNFQTEFVKQAAVIAASREAVMAAASGAAGAASASDPRARGTKRSASTTAVAPTSASGASVAAPIAADVAPTVKERRRQLCAAAAARTAAAALLPVAPTAAPYQPASAGTPLPSAAAPPFFSYPGMQPSPWPPSFQVQWPPHGIVPTSSGPGPQFLSQPPQDLAPPERSSKRRGAPAVPKTCSRCHRFFGGAKQQGFVHMPLNRGEATLLFCTKDNVNLLPLTGDEANGAAQ